MPLPSVAHAVSRFSTLLLATGLVLANGMVSMPAVAADLDPQAASPAAASQLPADSTTDSTVESAIVLSLQERRVYLYRDDTLVKSYPVAIGAAETPTPQGQFFVSRMVVDPVWQSPWTGEVYPPGPDSALGLRWIEFTSNAEGAFGFHGTPTVESIGQAASNGCVRMYNEDVVELFAQVQVGTPVRVEL